MQQRKQQQQQQVKLLTYNIFIRPPGIRNNDNDYKDERLECLISTDLNVHQVVKKSTSSNEGITETPTSSKGVPYSIYGVDKDLFPYIPWLSPWRAPKYHSRTTSNNKKSNTTTTTKQQQKGGYKQPLKGSIIGQYDIICFQELFSAFSTRQRRFIERAKQQQFKYVATSPLPSYFRSTFLVDGGIVILSKYPIVKTEYLLFKQGVDSDMLASKGVLYAKILISNSNNSNNGKSSPSDKYLHLFSTHLQASYAAPASNTKTTPTSSPTTSNTSSSSEEENDDEEAQQQPQQNGGRNNQKNDSVRIIQLNQLREFMKQMTEGEEQYPIILAGDLNIDSRGSKSDNYQESKEYKDMLDLLSNDPFDEEEDEKKDGSHEEERIFELIDLLKEDLNGCHPPTVGDTIGYNDGGIVVNEEMVARETCLTHRNDYGCMKRLDYILYMNHCEHHEKNLVKYNWVKGSTIVEPFFVEGFPFTQLSDHYGVSTTLQFNNQ